MKARIKFRKYSVMKYIGHLDVMRFFQKALRRAEIPVALSGGFSPHMIMSFAHPLGVGVTSDGEYFDIELTESIDMEAAVKRLNEVMVEGIDIVNMVPISDNKKDTGMSIVSAASYLSGLKEGSFPSDVKEQAQAFISQETIPVLKKTKKSEREVDIKPLIYDFEVREEGIYTFLATGSEENLKPELVMHTFAEYLGIADKEPRFWHHRLDVYANEGTKEAPKFVTLDQVTI